MISSITCADAKTGRQAEAIRTRQNFFIKLIGRHSSWACGQKVGSGRWAIFYSFGGEACVHRSNLTPETGEMLPVARSGGSHEREVSAIITHRTSCSEFAGSVQDGGTQFLSVARMGLEQKLFDSF